MKIVDWLVNNKITFDNGCLFFKHEKLNDLLHVLLSEQIDEFSECGSDFSFVQAPVFQELVDDNTKFFSVASYLIGDNFKIPKGAKIYSFMLSPEVVNMDKIFTEVTGGITPTIWDNDFIPRKHIILNYNVSDMEKDPINTMKNLYESLGNIVQNKDQKSEVFNTYKVMLRMYIPENVNSVYTPEPNR